MHVSAKDWDRGADTIFDGVIEELFVLKFSVGYIVYFFSTNMAGFKI